MNEVYNSVIIFLILWWLALSYVSVINTLLPFAHETKLATCIFNGSSFLHLYYKNKSGPKLKLAVVHISCNQNLVSFGLCKQPHEEQFQGYNQATSLAEKYPFFYMAWLENNFDNILTTEFILPTGSAGTQLMSLVFT